jgi:pyruvate/2-oxoglutarate dehydrogenase complex dihydrolipoamide acyltransferase (E2) component
MTRTGRASRTAARTTVAVGALGLVLSAAPAWALDPLPVPVPAVPAPLAPVLGALPLPGGLPTPSPSGSPLGLLAAPPTVPQAATAPKPVAAPKQARPAARPAAPKPPAAAPKPKQVAQSYGALLPMSASLGFGNDRPALASLPAMAALPGVLLAPEVAQAPQLAPVVEIRNAAAERSPISSVPGGLPGLLVAAGVLVVGAAGAGQLALMRARRRTTA